MNPFSKNHAKTQNGVLTDTEVTLRVKPIYLSIRQFCSCVVEADPSHSLPDVPFNRCPVVCGHVSCLEQALISQKSCVAEKT